MPTQIELLAALKECILRAGFTGATLPDIWRKMEAKLSITMTVLLKNFLWRDIRKRALLVESDSRRLYFYMTPVGSARTAASYPYANLPLCHKIINLKTITNPELTDCSEGWGLRDATRRVATEQELSLPINQLEDTVGGFWLRVVGNPMERAFALGIYDPNIQLAATAYAILETVASFAEEGVNQSDLGQLVGLEPKHLFHYLKSLERYGFIRRRKIVLKREGKAVQTNHILLTQYDKLGASEIDDAGDDAGEDEEGGDAVELVTTSIVPTDVAMRICHRLNGAKNRTLRDVDLQAYAAAATGSLQKGIWPTLRRKMLNCGYFSHKMVAIKTGPDQVQHWKSITLEKMPQNARELEVAFLQDAEANKAEARKDTACIEYPLEYYMWHLIQEQGQQGKLRYTLKFVGISHKFVIKRIDSLIKDRKIVQQLPYSSGKVRTFLLKTTGTALGPMEERAMALNAPKPRKPKPLVEQAPGTPVSAPLAIPQASRNTPHVTASPNPQASDLSPVQLARGPKHQKFVTLKNLGRRQFIMDTLNREKLVLISTLRKMIAEHEADTEGEIDIKALRRVIAELTASGEAMIKNTGIVSEEGSIKPVELVILGRLSDAEWKQALKTKSLDSLVTRHAVVPERPILESVSMESIDTLNATGELLQGQRPKQRRMLFGTKYMDDADEAVDEMTSESEGEPVTYMETDDEANEREQRPKNAKNNTKKAQRKKAQNRRIEESDREDVDEDDNDVDDDQDEDRDQANAPSVHFFHETVGFGFERAKLLRARVVHAWLCTQLFGEDKAGSLAQIVPNNVEAVRREHLDNLEYKNKYMDVDKPAAPAKTKPAPPEASSPARRPVDKANGTTSSSGHHYSRHAPNHDIVGILTAPTESSREHRVPRARPSRAADLELDHLTGNIESSVVRQAQAAPAAPHAISAQEAKQRWFKGPTFKMHELLPEMPLYIYMKAFGVTDTMPGLADPIQESDKKIKDLSAEAQHELLESPRFPSRLKKVVELLKEMNLIQPLVAFADVNEDGEVQAGPDTRPAYEINPIGVIWYRPVSDEGKPAPEQCYFFEFDYPQPEPEVSEYWLTMQADCQEMLRALDGKSQLQHHNHPPPARAFPTRTGLPNCCLTHSNWTGGNKRKAMKHMKSLWPRVSAEMDQFEPGQPTPTMRLIAETFKYKPTVVLSYFTRLRARKQKKKKNVGSNSAYIPVAKRPKQSALTAEEESATIDLRATHTGTNKKSKGDTIAINLSAPKGRAPRGASRAATDENADNDQELLALAARIEAGDDDDDDDDAPRRRASRFSRKQINAFLTNFIQQKAAAGLHLDDESTLMDGIDKDKLAEQANKPWESLEKHLQEIVSNHASMYILASRIASAIRERNEEEGEEEEAPVPAQPEIRSLLPRNIRAFRENNTIRYGKLAETTAIGFEDYKRRMAEEKEKEPELDKVPKTFYSVLPPSVEMASKIEENAFYEFTNAESTATCSRGPPSRWLEPQEGDLLLADLVKTILWHEADNDAKNIVNRRLTTPELKEKAMATYTLLQKRRVVTMMKNNSNRPRLSANWKVWERAATVMVEFAAEARKHQQELQDEKQGLSETSAAAKDPKLVGYWNQPVDLFAPGPKVAALLHQLKQEQLYAHVEIASINPLHRRFRKQSVKTPKKFEPAAENDDLALSIAWWHEDNILTRYASDQMCKLFPLPLKVKDEHGTAELEEELEVPNQETIELPSLHSASPPSTWDLFEETQLALGEADDFVNLCRRTLSVIAESKDKAIELLQLERALVARGFLDAAEDSTAPYPMMDAAVTLKAALNALVSFRLALRVLGIYNEAWVAVEHSSTWTVLPSSRTVTIPDDDDAAAPDDDGAPVVFQPWTSPSGSTCQTMLSNIRAHVAQMIISQPGISEESILDAFDIFRPAVAREILEHLQLDALVTVRYFKYSVHRWSQTTFTASDPSDVVLASEEDYHAYMHQLWAHKRENQQPPQVIVHKGFWPELDIHIRL